MHLDFDHFCLTPFLPPRSQPWSSLAWITSWSPRTIQLLSSFSSEIPRSSEGGFGAAPPTHLFLFYLKFRHPFPLPPFNLCFTNKYEAPPRSRAFIMFKRLQERTENKSLCHKGPRPWVVCSLWLPEVPTVVREATFTSPKWSRRDWSSGDESLGQLLFSDTLWGLSVVHPLPLRDCP